MKSLSKSALMLAAGAIVAGCLGETHIITLDEKTARLEFGVVAVELEAGDGQIVDFCVALDEEVCGFPGGEVVGCGLDVSVAEVMVLCADPLLVQWPDTWSLTKASWSAPSVPASGSLVVDPALFCLLPEGANIITDPGHSAYVVRLDLDSDFGPADVNFDLEFDHGGDTQGVVLKAVEVMIAEVQSALQEKIIIPLEQPVIDFPNLPEENTLEVMESVPVRSSTWSRLKNAFQR